MHYQIPFYKTKINLTNESQCCKNVRNSQ